MKISEVKKIIEVMDPRDGLKYLEGIDEKGIAVKLHEKLNIEFKRLKKMLVFEEQVYSHGLMNPAGIDEVGRGPLAGPVVAAAVILPEDYMIYGLNDSKKVSTKRRMLLDKIIRKDAVDFTISAVDNFRIDKINILRASKEAMMSCVKQLETKPGYLLIDAVHIEGTDIKQAGIIQGDGRSLSIAAASIIAKVYRDSLMCEYDSMYPVYGFCRNKGYGTKEHIVALKKYGPCQIHRTSFIKNIV